MLTKNGASRGPKALGIDFGEKRIGLAVSDPLGRWAMPAGCLERTTDRKAAYQIADIARSKGVQVLVLGEPLGLDGTTGPAVDRVRAFGKRLEKITGLQIAWVNEALTTVEAAERLGDVQMDTLSSPERRDAVAAQILLQEALDRGVNNP